MWDRGDLGFVVGWRGFRVMWDERGFSLMVCAIYMVLGENMDLGEGYDKLSSLLLSKFNT